MSLSIQTAQEIIGVFSDQSILVAGDLMLDRYVRGKVTRISPEAPVPVVHVQHEQNQPGGACNVACNIRALGGQAAVMGVLGKDKAADDLARALDAVGVNTDLCTWEEGATTTVKTRVVAEQQQVVRIDWEQREAYEPATLAGLKETVPVALEKRTGIIVEDYGKGVVDQQILDAIRSAANERGIPIGLDPQEDHQLDLSGLDLITPNRREAFVAAGLPVPDQEHVPPLEDTKLEEVSGILFEKWHPKLLLITLGSQGMLLTAGDGLRYHVPTRAQEVYDVSGAGDTVIATCMLALSAGAEPRVAADLANHAAGVVVGKLGTATCSADELMNDLQRASPGVP